MGKSADAAGTLPAGTAAPAAFTPALAGPLPALVRPDARVGIFGGTFDPVHLGHLALARAALHDLALDHLFFLPAAQAPLRDGPPAAAAARLELLRLALAEFPDPRLGLLDLEARAGGIHYSIDTLRHLHAAWPRARLFWLLGSDQFAQLDRWREPRELARLAEFAVLKRPGQSSVAPPPSLASSLRWQTLAGPAHPASAAEIRRRRHAGEPWDFWLPRPVAAAIEEQQLYR
jgi:nicotinate-nucleotide adenylyltransferase